MQICRALYLVIIWFFVRFSISLIELVSPRFDDDDAYSSNKDQCQMNTQTRQMIIVNTRDDVMLSSKMFLERFSFSFR